ncbi:hypothetical protein ACHAWF_005011 [Thalassiosira exigua]
MGMRCRGSETPASEVSKKLHPNRIFQLSVPIAPTRNFFIIGDSLVARTIFSDPATTKPKQMYGNLINIFGAPTMLTLNGPRWHAKRKASAPAFSSNHIKRMNRVALEKTESWIKDTLEGLASTGESFDVGNEMIDVVLSSLLETAFEYQMSKHERQLLREQLNLVSHEYIRKSASNPLRKMFGRFISERQRAERELQNLRATVRDIMATHKRTQDRIEGTLIRRVMESDAFANDDERLAQLFEFLFAGHDTTAFSIAWILFCLAKYPEEQRELREALGKLSPEEWSSCLQLRNAVKEGMRMYPVARSVRQLGRDVMTSSGLLPKDSICSVQFFLIFRDPTVFANPSEFIPSRWDNPSRDMLDSFLPFAHGKQNCVGQSLAGAETHAIVARICSEFALEVAEEGTSEFSILFGPAGVRLRAQRL